MIDDNFLEENKDELEVKIQTIKNENHKLKTCDNALHITYEELYFSTKGIEEFTAAIQHESMRNVFFFLGGFCVFSVIGCVF